MRSFPPFVSHIERELTARSSRARADEELTDAELERRIGMKAQRHQHMGWGAFILAAVGAVLGTKTLLR